MGGPLLFRGAGREQQLRHAGLACVGTGRLIVQGSEKPPSVECGRRQFETQCRLQTTSDRAAKLRHQIGNAPPAISQLRCQPFSNLAHPGLQLGVAEMGACRPPSYQ